ncbi:MAG: hypothetical protein AB8B55_21360 [Mariniblastus sp.]
MGISKKTLAFRTLLIAAFALWFGGFTFYVSFVVPIGTEILGSARRQGLITQQVTHWLNIVCLAAVLMMLAESILSWKRSSRPRREIQLAMVVLIGGFLAALVWLHPQLDGMIDVESKKIKNKAEFYGLHRVYLWLSTLQWVAAWAWIPMAINGWFNRSAKS